MFQFTGSDLPQKALPIAPKPSLVLWNSSSRNLAPFARIDRIQLGEIGASGNLGNPNAIAFFEKFDLQFTISRVAIPGFIDISADPEANKTLNSFWFTGSFLYLIYNNFPTTIEVELQNNLSTNDFSAINLPENFTVTSLCANGLTFLPGSNPGEFQQTLNTISISTSPEYRLIIGDPIYYTGSYNLTSNNPLTVVAFIITEIDILDALDWLGSSFVPAENILEPQNGEFFWSNNVVFLFTEKTNLPQAQPIQDSQVSNYIGMLTC